MKEIEKIYELIQNDSSPNTYLNNKELFSLFYFNYMDIKTYGPKVVKIMKYMLSIKDSISEYDIPLLETSISDSFNRYEQRITQGIRSNSSETFLEDIDSIKELIEIFNSLKKYDKEDKYFDRHNLDRDISSTLTIILNKSFFDMPNDIILECIDIVKNNSYSKEKLNNSDELGILDKDYIDQYFNRFIPVLMFTNPEEVKKDALVQRLLNGEIKDVELLTKCLRKMDYSFVLEYFDYDFENIVNLIDKITNNEEEKKKLASFFRGIVSKENQNYIMLNYLLKNKDTTLFDKENIEAMLILGILQRPNELNEEDTNLILDNKDYLINYIGENIFGYAVRNAVMKSKQGQYSNETMEKISEHEKNYIGYLCKDMTFEESLEVLKKIFNGEKVDKITIYNALTRIARTYLFDENARLYVGSRKYVCGEAVIGSDEITINVEGINKLLTYEGIEDDPNKLHILDTLFHEARHLEQGMGLEDDEMSDIMLIHLKEFIMDDYSSNYYSDNYKGISYEKEARVFGAYTLARFLKEFFPDMTYAIDFYSELGEKERNEKYPDKKVFSLSPEIPLERAFDKLMSFHPEILEKHPELAREYNSDGVRINNDKKQGGI